MAETSAAVTGSGASTPRAGVRGASTPADNYLLARRRTLQVVVSSLLTEAGFESAEKATVETMTEMLQSCECGLSMRHSHYAMLLTVCERSRHVLLSPCSSL
ncbi:hypothetical protein FKM82_029645 [Ascaphus truei]